MRRFKWAIVHLCTITGCRDIRQNVKFCIIVKWKCRCFTFCQLSRHPVIVQRCTIAHSNRLIATIRMSYSASLYDRWVPRYPKIWSQSGLSGFNPMIIRIDPGGSRIVKFHPDRISTFMPSERVFSLKYFSVTYCICLNTMELNFLPFLYCVHVTRRV